MKIGHVSSFVLFAGYDFEFVKETLPYIFTKLGFKAGYNA